MQKNLVTFPFLVACISNYFPIDDLLFSITDNVGFNHSTTRLWIGHLSKPVLYFLFAHLIALTYAKWWCYQLIVWLWKGLIITLNFRFLKSKEKLINWVFNTFALSSWIPSAQKVLLIVPSSKWNGNPRINFSTVSSTMKRSFSTEKEDLFRA